MPEVSGFGTTAVIRRSEALSGTAKKVHVAALTSLVSDKDRRAAHIAGVDEYITKPAGREQVQAVITRWRRAQS